MFHGFPEHKTSPKIPKNFIRTLYKSSRTINSIITYPIRQHSIQHLFSSRPDLSGNNYLFLRELKTLLLINLIAATLFTAEDIFFETLEKLRKVVASLYDKNTFNG